MADYYPLIARAIAGLDPSAPGESRRALYERARAALIAQLRSVEPPLSESEITRERLSLEEAVRKVESEAAQRARDATRSGGGDAARSGARAGDAFRANNRSGTRPSPSRNDRPPLGQEDPSGNLRADQPRSSRLPPGPIADAPPSRERTAAPRRGGDDNAPPAPGMRGFRDIAADADDLGRAAAQANRAARKTYANVPSPSPEFDRLEPSMENRSGDPEAPYSYDESIQEAERYSPQAPPMQPPPQRARIGQGGEREPNKRARTGAVFPIKSAIALGVVLILVGAGILWGKQAVTVVSGLFKSQPAVEAPKDASTAPQSKPKIPDRVGQPSS